MEWPGQQPDLNPIENLWAAVNRKVSVAKSKNNKELCAVAKELWNKTPKERCQDLAYRMCSCNRQQGPRNLILIFLRYMSLDLFYFLNIQDNDCCFLYQGNTKSIAILLRLTGCSLG